MASSTDGPMTSSTDEPVASSMDEAMDHTIDDDSSMDCTMAPLMDPS